MIVLISIYQQKYNSKNLKCEFPYSSMYSLDITTNKNSIQNILQLTYVAHMP